MNGRKILSIMLLCAMMLSLFVFIPEEAEAATVDYIAIVDTPGTGIAEIPDQTVNVGQQITGYAASFNNTLGYQGDVSVTWSVQKAGGATAQTNPPTGPNSTFDAGVTGGTATWKADDGLGHMDTVVFTVNPPTVDYIVIDDGEGMTGDVTQDQLVGFGFTITGYTGGYNYTAGYVGDVPVTWSVQNLGGATAFTNPPSGTNSTFNSGTSNGTAIWIAEDGAGHNDTVQFTISDGGNFTVDYIEITDTPGGAPLDNGTVSPDSQFWGYCSAYNYTIGYIGLGNADWTAEGGNAFLLNITPTEYNGIDVGTVYGWVWFNASYGGQSYSINYYLSPPSPTVDYILILNAPGSGASEIPDQSIDAGIQIAGYAASFNNTVGYLWEEWVDWTVVNAGGATASTNPPYNSTSVFYSGLTNGTATWKVDDGSGHNDTVVFTIINGTDYDIDYIEITDVPDGVPLPGGSVLVTIEEWGYCSAYNISGGYLGIVNADWTAEGGSSSLLGSTPATTNGIYVGTIPGTVWFNASYSGKSDSVQYTVNPATTDYVMIVDLPNNGSNVISDQTINLNYTITGYAAGFNNTMGYIGDISGDWTVIPSGGEDAYTTPPTGTSSTFNSGTIYGSVTWLIDDGSGHSDTVVFTISSGGGSNVDYIIIVDTGGIGSSEIPDQTVNPWFEITGYAAAFNMTVGYIGDVVVTWTVSNSNGSNASTSPSSGSSSTFYANDAYGVATWYANDGAGHVDTVVFTIGTVSIDYILITSSPGGPEIADQTINIGFNVHGRASAYNNTSGYIGTITVTWSVTNYDGATAYTTPTSGSGSTFAAGTTGGNATWTADDGSGHTDTVWFTITDYTVDFILIRSLPGGGGSEIPDQTVFTGFDETGYAAAYNNTFGFIDDISVTWTVSNANGSNASTSPSSGESSSFHAGNQEGIATWTADDGNGHIDTVIFTITTGPSPTVDYIMIVDTPNNNGSTEIPDQTVPVGYQITGYAAAYNYTLGYISDVTSFWTVVLSGGENATTSPPTGTSSTFDSGTISGYVTWIVDDGAGHTDTVGFTIPFGGPDYIQIVDSPGTGTIEIPNQTVIAGFSITGYAAAFNNTAGYVGDVSVTWTVQNSGGASAYTNPSTGVSSQFHAGPYGGTATWTADYVGVLTDTVVFTILPPTIDYIRIFDGPGSGNGSQEIQDRTIDVGTNITGYAVAFNNSIGYLYDVSVFWSVVNLNGASASTAPLTGMSSVFNAGSTNGNATWMIDDGMGHTDTVTFTIVGQIYSIDYISIRDAPGGAGNIIGDRTYCVWETDTFYAVAYNFTIGYLMDVEVSWASDNDTIGNVTTPGVSTLFTAQWIVADDICIVTATYNTLTNTTGNLEVLSPRTDYVQIQDAPDGGGAVITSISYNKGDEDVFYGASYNNTVDFIGDVPSSAAWNSTNPSIVNVTSPGSSSAVKCSDMNSGTVTVTLTVGIIHINTTIVVVLEWEVDYILIRDGPSGGGKNLCDPMNYTSYPVGYETTFYGAMYNYTAGYIGDVGSNSNWSCDDTSIVEVTSPGVYSTITCSNTNYGTVTIGLEEWMGHNATTLVTVIEPTMDYITAVDASGGSGNPIGDMTYEIEDEDTYYAAAFNITAGYLFDVSVSWSSSDTSIGTVDPAIGSSTVFTAESMGTCVVTADYGGGISDSTGTLTVTLPSNITVSSSGGAHFTTIQEGINNAQEGDTVFVYSGTYHEHLFIDKSITLMGEDRFNTIIDGDGYGKVIFVTGDNVNIRGFTIQDGEYGIYCQETDTTTIEYNIIKDYDYGIYCNMTIDGYIAHNTITIGQYGIVTFEAYNDAIKYNTISYNTEYGAKDYNSQLKNCFNWNYFHNNTIAYYYDPDTPLEPIEFDGNIIENNQIGIEVENADTITITNNIMKGNEYGILLLNASPNIADNSISSSEYGIYGEYSSPTISNNIISDILEHGIFAIYGDGLKIINNTMIGTDMIFIDSTIAELWAEDTSITQVNTTVEDAHLDDGSALEIQWTLRVRVMDENGEPVEDAVVLIYDVFDNLVSVQNTDSEGWIEAIDVIEKEEGAAATIIYNPFSVHVIKGDADDTQTLTVEGDTEHVISLQTGAIESAETVFPWILAFFLVIGAFVVIGLGGIAFEVIKYGLLIFFLPLYSRIKKREMLEQPIRHRIHGYIIGNPGAHYGLIKQDLSIPNGQLVYHLNQLSKAHLIYSREDGIRKRFYPVALPVPKSGKILLTKVQKEILDVVEDSSGANQKEIASSMGVSRQVAGYHLTKMEEKGFVRKELEGRETRYYPLENADA